MTGLLITLTFFCAFVVLAVFLLLIRFTNRWLKIENRVEQLDKGQFRIEGIIKEEIARNRNEYHFSARQSREEMAGSMKSFEDSLLNRIKDKENSQKNQLDIFSGQLASLTRLNDDKLEKIREVVQKRLQTLQEENTRKLEQMRSVVDDKLHATLEKRLGESFKLVNDRLESVYRGLGEMKTLASSVGDLKKVLTNVKTRGVWGEMQLGNILEQMLAKEQYQRNVATKKGSNCHVEFAVKFPVGSGKTVWLPIDAKFPKEDYERLMEAQEKGHVEKINEIKKSLDNRIRAEAKDIKEKYIDPPNTTDVGVLFLGTEGLYAEVLSCPGLVDFIQTKYRVIVTGPMIMSALLSIVQMGAQAFAIERRALQVWELLGAIKTEFGKFGDILDRTHKKLQEASNTIEDASRKSRTIQRKLKNVQELPSDQARELISGVLEVEYDSEGQGNTQS